MEIVVIAFLLLDIMSFSTGLYFIRMDKSDISEKLTFCGALFAILALCAYMGYMIS